MNPADDPGSLSHLHDIVNVPPVPWWPPTTAWFVIGALLLLSASFLFAAMFVHRRNNWYRRAGLDELRQIELSNDSVALVQVAELLKRVALVAYPRPEVACLTNQAWLDFLDRTSGSKEFSSGAGRLLSQIYDRSPAVPTKELFELVRRWIRHHRRMTRC